MSTEKKGKLLKVYFCQCRKNTPQHWHKIFITWKWQCGITGVVLLDIV